MQDIARRRVRDDTDYPSASRDPRGRARRSVLPAAPTSWLPPEMTMAPALPLQLRPGPVEPRTALLVNPFYAKSPRGSFGKHVLTPSLALTSIAAATPPGWHVRYWDENLLQGPPPIEPVPQVVGITVHLTFARRAYELAAWYRARGSKVVLGGLHIQACEEEAAPHADASASATACRPGRPSCATLNRRASASLRGGLRARLRPRPSAQARPCPPERVPDHGQRDRHARLLQPVRVLLSGNGNLRMPYRVRRPQDVAREIEAAGQPYAVFIDNNLGGNRHICASVRRLAPVGHDLERGRHAGCHRRPVTGPGDGARRLRRGVHRVRVAERREPRQRPEANAARRGLRAARSPPAGPRHPGERQLRRRLRRRPRIVRVAGQWIDVNRLECATFHILTPYPGTPLFGQLDAEGRLLHRNWALYDTAHAVFLPNT